MGTELLDRARTAVDPVLRAAVGELPESMRRIASYHFGWQDAAGDPSRGDAGKAIRPALVIATAEALGGQAGALRRAAAAVELVHNFTLLHDDVIDRDLTRRHRPTAWSVFGSTGAILAGDALHALALRTLADDGHPAAGGAIRRLAACVVELCDGQYADWVFEERTDVTLGECLRMAEAKTGALLGCACAVGALYAGAGEEVAEVMDAFGREVGMAFQLIDDLLGIWGDPLVTGKPAGADLVARKKSLPVVAALTSGTPAGAELAAIYASPGVLRPVDVDRAAGAVERSGGRAWAEAQAADRMAVALNHLTRAVADPEAIVDLLAISEVVTRRRR